MRCEAFSATRVGCNNFETSQIKNVFVGEFAPAAGDGGGEGLGVVQCGGAIRARRLCRPAQCARSCARA